MSISSRYEAQEVEKQWYEHWMNKGYFHSTPDEREPYTILMPPPNVTGILHMGHMLNNTIQDVLIRKARLDGKNACWIPGTDHASIATEAKVVKLLREQGIKKSDLTRDEFLAHAWEWKEEYGGKILDQLKKLGASADWERTAFTMDEPRSKNVTKSFVDLYKKGKIFKGLRMINWDPEAQTVLSNEEVIYSDEQSNLYHVKYQIEGTDEWITIATTRPETILGDSAIAVHPKDERYAHLKGKMAIVPLIGRKIPIIFDDYVDVEFGTGALKVTPAHDVNDYELGKKHDLEVIEILNDDGSLNEAAQLLVGEDRFKARISIKILLKESGNLVEIESYKNNVGRSERTNAIIEPKLSLQWYIDMKSIAAPALEGVMSDEIEFFPKNQKNTYRHWMENIRDWCISRQLWWGHRIPAWYVNEGEKLKVYVGETVEEAFAEAQKELKDVKIEDLRQDEDVLDTWFSSWLWPISTIGGFGENDEEFNYYYPTNVLVTGWDIIFLWVARMAMAGYEYENKYPFKDVYFTGMVRDKQRRKMSKQLGNSPDALKLIGEYGADGVRFGMLSCSPAGGDLLYDNKLVENGRNFSNKIWNALRLIKGWDVKADADMPAVNAFAANWLNAKKEVILVDLAKGFEKYKLSEALMSLYSFIWTDFCSWYLEMVKPSFGESIDPKSLAQSIDIMEELMLMLHPFMPFISEEVYHILKEREEGDDLIVSKWPVSGTVDNDFVNKAETVKEIVTNIRDIRNTNGIKMKDELEFFMKKSDASDDVLKIEGWKETVVKLGNLSSFEMVDADVKNAVSFIVGTHKFYVVLNIEVDVEAEILKLEEELKYQEGFVNSVKKKLDNERFVSNAPEQVVAMEKKKMADGLSRMANIKETLEGYKS